MSPRLRLACLGLAIGAIFVTVALTASHDPEQLRGAVRSFGVLAPLAVVGAWVALTPALFSGTILAAVGGLALGVPLGTAAGVVGATLGGLVSFLVARGGGARAVEAISGERVRALQERLERRGFAAVLCARIAPGVPTTLLNYACGLARVRLRDFAAASAVAGAPRVFAYTALGASGGDLRSPAALAGLTMIVVLALGTAASVWIRRLRRDRPDPAHPDDPSPSVISTLVTPR